MISLALALFSSLSPSALPEVPFANGFPVTTRAKIYPLAEITRGKIGVGYTVLAEDDVTSFGVEVLGVMDSMLGPNKPVILAKLTGDAIAFTGVIAGMSGSPVYIDGRLVGAVAYRFGAFSKEPIAGITPIETMLEAYGDEIEPLGGGSRAKTAISVASLRSRELLPAPPLPEARTVSSDARPIETPLSFAGVDPVMVESLRDRLRGIGYVSSASGLVGVAKSRGLQANAADKAGTVDAAPIAPGSPIAALLMKGDMNVAAIGTVTMVEGSTVYAFGHPFLGWGHVDFPMYTAAILNTLASEAGSYKQGIAAREVGSITHDRLTAIAGKIGESAAMVPVRVRVERLDVGGRGKVELTNVEVVDDQTWFPVMTEAAIGSAASRRMGYEAGGTVDMDVLIHVGDRTLRVVDTYASPPPIRVAAFIARDISNVLATIEQNDLERAEITGVEATIRTTRVVAMATIDDVSPDRTVVEAGATLSLLVGMERYRGSRALVPISVEIPRDAEGAVEIFVGGGVEMDRREGDAIGARFPSDLDDLLGILAERRPARSLYARAFFPREGLRRGASVLESLPPSARSYLSAEPDRTRGAVHEAMGKATEVAFADVIVGGMAVPITVIAP